MNKIYFVILLVVVALVVAVLLWQFQVRPEELGTSPVRTGGRTISDTTTAIENDLKTVDLGNLDVEFQAIDRDLNSL